MFFELCLKKIWAKAKIIRFLISFGEIFQFFLFQFEIDQILSIWSCSRCLKATQHPNISTKSLHIDWDSWIRDTLGQWMQNLPHHLSSHKSTVKVNVHILGKRFLEGFSAYTYMWTLIMKILKVNNFLFFTIFSSFFIQFDNSFCISSLINIFNTYI